MTTSRIARQNLFEDEPDCSLWIPELSDELWSWTKELPKLKSIATANKGLEHKGEGRPKGARTVEDDSFEGSREGYDLLKGRWGIHEHPAIRYFNVDSDVIRRRGSGLDEIPQVLVNHSPMGRGRWRLKPFIDDDGRVLASSLIAVRPKGAIPLEYLWALLISPLANLYVYCFTLKRNIHTGILEQMPVPDASDRDVRRVVTAVERYREVAAQPRTLLEQDGFTNQEVTDCLLQIDAEILRLYELPASAERLLLDEMGREERPGIPVKFGPYYPSGFNADIPLYVFRSASFQCFLAGDDCQFTVEDEHRYEMLHEQFESGALSDAEIEELRVLQAEVDGRDFALDLPNSEWIRNRQQEHEGREKELRMLTQKLADIEAGLEHAP